MSQYTRVLIALVAILSFCLPPASGEKVSLSVTSLLTQTVFMLMLSQEMPTTSETIPLLQQYFAVILCVVSVSTILTIFVLNLHYRGIHEKHVPPTVRKLFLNKYMARLFHPSISHQFEDSTDTAMTDDFLRKSHLVYRNHAAVPQLVTPSLNSRSLLNGLRFNHVPIESISLNGTTTGFKAQADSGTRNSPQGTQDGTLQPMEKEVLSEMLTRIDERSRNKEMSKVIAKEWVDLATILDRIFFLICFTGFLVTSIILFTPHHHQF
ncbi:CHRNA7-FAM7A fusion protein-like [Liolophura sinensis]|uniref:CHRNA7-FAM7A fusion protein-like n=1 Tax=Liolophura sinensis TaxID=3198878 RepID=UPI003158355C